MRKILSAVIILFLLAAVGYCADAEKPNFTLYVSNQSLDIKQVDVKVYLDGKLVIDEMFDVKGQKVAQHNQKAFYFRLSNGEHTIKVESKKGKAKLEQKFIIKDINWAVINYWHSYKQEREGLEFGKRHFTFMIQDKPIGFD